MPEDEETTKTNKEEEAAPQATEQEAEEKPTKESRQKSGKSKAGKGQGGGDFQDRIARLEARHKDEMEAAQATSASEKAEIEKRHADQLNKLKEALGVEADSEDDPAARAEEMTRKAKDALRRSQFRLVASEAGINTEAIDDAYKLLQDRESIPVDLDSGEVKGMQAAVERLLEEKKWLRAPDPEPAQSQRKAAGGGPANPAETSGEEDYLDDDGRIRENDPSKIRQNFSGIARSLRRLIPRE